MTTPETVVTADSDGATDKRKLALVGAVAAVALAAGGWYLIGGSGGSGDVSLAPVAHHVAKPVVRPAVATAKRAAKLPALVPSASNVKLGRDPFHPLYVVPPVAPATTTTTTDTSGTGTGATGSSSTTTTATPAAPYSLTLLGISGTDPRSYTFNVGGTKKAVVAAQKFGKYGELVVLSSVKNSKGSVTGALIQVGDDDPVTISLGEKLTVL